MMNANPGISRGTLERLFNAERPITVDEACGLRLLLFGNTVNSFESEWQVQGFNFRQHPTYALRQKQPGPCGVLAAVQACILYELLFGYSQTVLDFGLLRPKKAESKEALARALVNILWQAGDYKEAIVARKCKNEVLDDSTTTNIIAKDGILEYIRLIYFRSIDDLLQHMYNHIDLAMKEEGCILFLYSLILTHGIDRIKEEMDYPESHFIGSDGFCSQEVVNLILTGRAVPNLFNGEMECNFGGNETSCLRGIPKQSKIGHLGLFEFEGAGTVGSYYKDPQYPIWIMLEQHHYTVLFGTRKSILQHQTEQFDLFYCDCFAKRNDEISFKIYPYARKVMLTNNEKISIPVKCLLTRWPLARAEEVTI